MDCSIHAVETFFGANSPPEWILDVLPRMKLCHGFPTLTVGPDKGKVGFHAWLEFDTLVLDCGTIDLKYSVIPRPLYYYVGKIEDQYVARYTMEEAAAMLDLHENYGPWHEGDPRAEI